jgi:hypothetical protein
VVTPGNTGRGKKEEDRTAKDAKDAKDAKEKERQNACSCFPLRPWRAGELGGSSFLCALIARSSISPHALRFCVDKSAARRARGENSRGKSKK